MKRKERELELQSGPSVIKKKKLSSEKRKMEEQYELNEHLYKDFNWRETKKLKLDSLNDRKAALNERQSFTMLVSSASLILPPEVNSVLISRNNYLVEWNHESAENPIPPTKVTQAVEKERSVYAGDEIHKAAFKIPCSYHNNAITKNFRDETKREKRMIVQSQIKDGEHSFLLQSSLTKNKLMEKKGKKEKTTHEKLTNAIQAINESIYYFEHIPPENVPIRDKQLVSIFYLFLYSGLDQNCNLI